MTDADAIGIATQYDVSFYTDVDHILAHKTGVAPRPSGNSIVDSMRANVEEAVTNRDAIRRRYEDADRDGLFNLESIGSLGKTARAKWLGAITTQHGDRDRCIAELKHWRGYLGWAMEQARALQPIAPDSRLPPERDSAEEGVPF